MKSKYYQRFMDSGQDIKKRLANIMYHNQRRHCEERGHNPPEYSRMDLYYWLINHSDFDYLFNNWVASGFERDLIPSVDRIDNTKTYSFGNVRLITFRENYTRPHKEKQSGIAKHDNKAVSQFDLDGKYIQDFHSMHEAWRQTGIEYRNIHKVCQGTRNKAGGYKWSYKT